MRGWAAVTFWLLVSLCSWGAAGEGEAMIRVRTLYPTGNLKLWVSDDGVAWRFVDDSTAFFRAAVTGGAHDDYRFLLPALPAFLRVGITGAVLGRVSIDSIDVTVGGQPEPVLAWSTSGTVLFPERCREQDDRPAILVHRGEEETVTGLVLRFAPGGRVQGPPAALPAKYGVYTGPRDDSDALAAAIAWWDFTVFQEGRALEACVRKVKAINPAHRVILRLVLPQRSFLLYAYDAESRDAIRRQVVDSYFGAFAELVDTVTLSEEEPGIMFRGIYNATLVPREVHFWKHKYEEERGEMFTWPPTAELNLWLGEKFEWMLNDLYDYVHERYPGIKVYQWVELRGFGNHSGHAEYVNGDTLKMDGYVLEWSGFNHQKLVDTPGGKAAARISYLKNYLTNLKERRGIDASEVLGQAWAFEPESRDTFEQIEEIRELGISSIYFFFPSAAMPGAFELYGRNDSPSWQYGEAVWRKLKPMIEAERAESGN